MMETETVQEATFDGPPTIEEITRKVSESGFKLDALGKARWLSALRSGDYEQAQGVLRDVAGGGYCCLGVYAEVDPMVTRTSYGYRFAGQDPYSESTHMLPPEIMPMYVQASLANLNDYHNWTFNQIADFVEEYL